MSFLAANPAFRLDPSARGFEMQSVQTSWRLAINAGPAVSNSGGGDNPFVADEDYSTGCILPRPISVPPAIVNSM